MKELQTELSPIAVSLRPRDMAPEELIPYMALEVRTFFLTNLMVCYRKRFLICRIIKKRKNAKEKHQNVQYELIVIVIAVCYYYLKNLVHKIFQFIL